MLLSFTPVQRDTALDRASNVVSIIKNKELLEVLINI